MLTKDCKTLLNVLIKATAFDSLFGWTTISKYIPTSFDSSKLISVLTHLQKEDYLSFEINVMNEVTYIELFHKAFSYKEISKIQIKEFAFKSVIIPIVVSLFTTFISLFIKSLF